MLRVLCAVDDAPGTAVALHAAIAYCRQQDAELGLVGVVRPGLAERWRDVPPARLPRYEGVVHSVEHAAQVARHAGLHPTVKIRAGAPRNELVAEGRATGATGLFLARTRSRLASMIKRRPRVDVETIEVASGGLLAAERTESKRGASE